MGHADLARNLGPKSGHVNARERGPLVEQIAIWAEIWGQKASTWKGAKFELDKLGLFPKLILSLGSLLAIGLNPSPTGEGFFQSQFWA